MNESTADTLGRSDAVLALSRAAEHATLEPVLRVARTFMLHRGRTLFPSGRGQLLQRVLDDPISHPQLSLQVGQRAMRVLGMLEKIGAQPEDIRAWIYWIAGDPKKPDGGFVPIFLATYRDQMSERATRDLIERARQADQRLLMADRRLFDTNLRQMSPRHRQVVKDSFGRARWLLGHDPEQYRLQIDATRKLARRLQAASGISR
jgi:hypothetical protein